MATRKNNFLNAKPVSKMGGKSGGVRKPSKPYSKPSSTSGKPKLQSKPQKPSARDVMPNSRAKKINLPQAANNAVPPKQGPTLKGTTPKKRIPPNAARDSMPNSRAKGLNLPKAANNAVPPKQGPSLRGVQPGLRSSAVTSGAGMAGRVFTAFGTALAIPAAIKNIADVAERNRQWDAYKERMGMNKPQSKPSTSSSSAGRRTGSNNRVANLSVPTSSAGSRAGAAAGTRARSRNTSSPNSGPDWRSRVSSQDVNTLRQGQNDAIRSYNNKPSASGPSASRPSQSTPSTRTASGSGTQRSTASTTPQKPAMPGRKWDDFNPGRGTSKSNNPLLDRDSGGMKLRDRMKERENAQRTESTKNLKNNFGQDSGYETKTKVDGSKYADKKPDMKKVNEYDRRKRRYYD